MPTQAAGEGEKTVRKGGRHTVSEGRCSTCSLSAIFVVFPFVLKHFTAYLGNVVAAAAVVATSPVYLLNTPLLRQTNPKCKQR